jgi:hypothetical protein
MSGKSDRLVFGDGTVVWENQPSVGFFGIKLRKQVEEERIANDLARRRPMPDDRLPNFDAEEERAMAGLAEVHRQILSWGLQGNGLELTAAIHVIQSFIIQRFLHRINPTAFSSWYSRAASTDPQLEESRSRA